LWPCCRWWEVRTIRAVDAIVAVLVSVCVRVAVNVRHGVVFTIGMGMEIGLKGLIGGGDEIHMMLIVGIAVISSLGYIALTCYPDGCDHVSYDNAFVVRCNLRHLYCSFRVIALGICILVSSLVRCCGSDL
jgi:hypothetical protein